MGFQEEDASDVVVTAGVICIWEARLFQTAPPRQTVIPDGLPAGVESTLLQGRDPYDWLVLQGLTVIQTGPVLILLLQTFNDFGSN